MADLESYIQSSTFSISEDTYSIIQATVMYHDAFAMVKVADDDITLIVKEKEATYHIPSKEILAIDKGWKIITIDAELPLDLIGFFAKISQVLADAHISIFAISSFATDHLLIKKDNVERAGKILVDLGFSQSINV